MIAYSTMSQIGYMFVAVGIGAYASGMFHLLTHAFFKALLFLAAGLVIHALIDEQDIRKMGGLGKLMPKTYVAFLVGGLALVGIPPFSGFFSKDPIIASELARGGWFGYTLYAPRPVRDAPDRPLHLPADLPRLRRRSPRSSSPRTCTGTTARGRS